MSEKKGSYTARKFHDPLDDLLDRPIAFNPAFKKITGSTVAALMLSQAWYWSKRTSDENGWFFKIGTEWEDETGLSRSEQETARKILKSLGLMEEELRGVPARLYYRVEKEEIYNMLGIQFAGNQQTSLLEGSIPDGDILANINRNAEITTGITPPEKKQKKDLLDGMLESEGIGERITACTNTFEETFGFGILPWGSNGIWKKFQRWVFGFTNDLGIFKEYVIWRNGEGKYKGAMTNVAIRRDPQIFMDTGWPNFLAHTAMYAEKKEHHPEWERVGPDPNEGKYTLPPKNFKPKWRNQNEPTDAS